MRRFTDWFPGTSTCFDGTADRETFERYAKVGIKYVEMSFGLNDIYGKIDLVNRAADYRRICMETGVDIRSIHLPFSGELDISNPNKEKRDFTMKTNLELMNAAQVAGARIAVVHPSSEPIAEDARESRLARSIENLEILNTHAKKLGMRLAVENLPRTCLLRHSDDVKKVIAAIPDIGITFDTNHLLIQDNIEFIHEVGDHIITLHVSDYDFIDERHLFPFKGKNDWKGIIEALKEVGYDGAWIYEVPSREGDTEQTIIDNYRALAALVGE